MKKKLRTVTLQEQHAVRVFKKGVLKRIFRPNREGITWWKHVIIIHNIQILGSCDRASWM